jgi:hypothetical protein
MNLSQIESVRLAFLTLERVMLILVECLGCPCEQCQILHPQCRSFLAKRVIVNRITGAFTSTAALSYSSLFLKSSGISEQKALRIHNIVNLQTAFLNEFHQDSAPNGRWWFGENARREVLDEESTFDNYADPNVYPLLNLVLQIENIHSEWRFSTIDLPERIDKYYAAYYCLHGICGLPIPRPSILRPDLPVIDVKPESSETENIDDPLSSDTSPDTSPEEIKDEDYQGDNDRSPPHVEDMPSGDLENEDYQDDDDPPSDS